MRASGTQACIGNSSPKTALGALEVRCGPAGRRPHWRKAGAVFWSRHDTVDRRTNEARSRGQHAALRGVLAERVGERREHVFTAHVLVTPEERASRAEHRWRRCSAREHRIGRLGASLLPHRASPGARSLTLKNSPCEKDLVDEEHILNLQSCSLRVTRKRHQAQVGGPARRHAHRTSRACCAGSRPKRSSCYHHAFGCRRPRTSRARRASTWTVRRGTCSARKGWHRGSLATWHTSLRLHLQAQTRAIRISARTWPRMRLQRRSGQIKWSAL